jgi:hypothetical protein
LWKLELQREDEFDEPSAMKGAEWAKIYDDPSKVFIRDEKNTSAKKEVKANLPEYSRDITWIGVSEADKKFKLKFIQNCKLSVHLNPSKQRVTTHPMCQ